LIALALVVVQGKVIVSEVVDPSANRARIEIVAGLSKLDRKEWAAVQTLGSTILRGTRSYTRFQLLQYATLAGDPIRVTVGPDHIRIGFSIPPGDIRLGVDLTDELIRGALLGLEDVQTAIDELPFRRRSIWSQAWLPLSVEPKGVTIEDVGAIYRKVFAPGNVSIGVGGSIGPGQSSPFLEKFGDWRAKPEPRRRYPDAAPNFVSSRGSSVTTVTFEGPEVSAVPVVAAEGATSELPAILLGVAMMGQGKGSTAFQVLRQAHGWSYRQEAFLRGSEGGVRPILAVGFASDPTSILERARTDLIKAVEAWTESDRARALRIGKANQELNLGLGTLYFAEERPLSESLDDRTFLSAYWRLKTGRSWDHNQVSQASLEQARTLTLKWLKDGTVRVIRGAGGVPGG
jgi:hypothetical protein